MRFSATVLFAASVASAYTILRRQTALPACAQTCYTNTSPSPCNNTDTSCMCVNLNYFTAFSTCYASTCSAEDAQVALAVTLETCKQAGVDLSQGNPIPTCARSCDPNDAAAPGCQPTDVACSCKDTTFVQSVNSCIKSSCTGQDLTNAETVHQAWCRAYGVDISSTA